jgi:hypothetical protein
MLQDMKEQRDQDLLVLPTVQHYFFQGKPGCSHIMAGDDAKQITAYLLRTKTIDLIREPQTNVKIKLRSPAQN